jgi:RimJ/RimL family protein N-acetyltransferase
MRVIESTNIDLIEPFPLSEAKRAFGWIHCYRNLIESDLSPKTPEEFEAYLQAILPATRSFGVIDKNNQLGFKHEVPLVGMIIFEPATAWNCYVHIASPRRAWGSGFMEEAIKGALTEVFDTEPYLTRVSAYVLENNNPVKGLARRLRWEYEGRMRDLITQNGEPKNVLHFGITRRSWVERYGQQVAEDLGDVAA